MTHPLPIVRTVADLRARLAPWRAAGEQIALVPTMGALHAGHLALVTAAKATPARTVATIFVNPKQFGANEDLDRYPRDEAGDAAALAHVGCDLLFAPAPAEVYPAGFATNVRVAGLSDVLDGAARPGHFDGVATVVTKLLTMARAHAAWFGEKDWQQLCVIRRLAADLNLETRIIGHPIVRAADGLALSSRNAYLSASERAAATALPAALNTAAAALAAGAAAPETLAAAHAALTAAGFDPIDYITLADAATLGDPVPGQPARLLAAAWLGKTRLIDNVAVALR
ncbi:pantoate--beta-alanine ligase [Glacieibacterium frigidum]|uniref:Pantothenate synthetase n=1 Tax=Glacieibacterium frigidum TaxID=2593303 RepID=A0A552UJ34_9SPHN|nr:pantoate--beta-alanine ligase [Glacieibacterium frigidum]TRW18237.1 pantoate--beta-alanine ligase [Glacieibacterium frigidum]